MASGPWTMRPKSHEPLRLDHPPLRAYVLDGADVVQGHQRLAEVPAQADYEKVGHTGQLMLLFEVQLYPFLRRLRVAVRQAQAEPLRYPADVGIDRDDTVAQRE